MKLILKAAVAECNFPFIMEYLPKVEYDQSYLLYEAMKARNWEAIELFSKLCNCWEKNVPCHSHFCVNRFYWRDTLAIIYSQLNL